MYINPLFSCLEYITSRSLVLESVYLIPCERRYDHRTRADSVYVLLFRLLLANPYYSCPVVYVYPLGRHHLILAPNPSMILIWRHKVILDTYLSRNQNSYNQTIA